MDNGVVIGLCAVAVLAGGAVLLDQGERSRATRGRFIRGAGNRGSGAKRGASKSKAAARWQEAVRRPGKFEGERPYVPYFWDQYLEGGADEDDGTVLTFKVTDEDKALFPELKRRKRVKLMERDDGFVVEV